MIHKADKYSKMAAMYQEPGALQAQTRSMAIGMGVSPEVYDAFAQNPYYNPAMQNATVGAIRSIEEATDKGKFFELAALADDPESALFFITIAQQLAEVHENEVPIVRMVAGVRILPRLSITSSPSFREKR